MTIAEKLHELGRNISRTKLMQLSISHPEKITSWRDNEYMKIAFSDHSYISIKRFNEDK